MKLDTDRSGSVCRRFKLRMNKWIIFFLLCRIEQYPLTHDLIQQFTFALEKNKSTLALDNRVSDTNFSPVHINVLI